MSGWLGGIPAALLAALLFGAATPLAKLLLGPLDPWLLAGVLYLGSGVGLAMAQLFRRTRGSRLARADVPWLAAAIFFGGGVGSVLLMWDLAHWATFPSLPKAATIELPCPSADCLQRPAA